MFKKEQWISVDDVLEIIDGMDWGVMDNDIDAKELIRQITSPKTNHNGNK